MTGVPITVTDGMAHLYGMLPPDGSTVQVAKLQTDFGRGHGNFDTAKQGLTDNGLATFHDGGAGGTLKRADNPPDEAKRIDQANTYPDEHSLYDDIAATIRRDWAPLNGFTDPDNLWVEVTGDERHKKGVLIHPDIVLYGTQKLLNTKSKQLITFEVKPRNQVDAKGIKEAIGQRTDSGASKAYVIYHLPSYRRDVDLTQILTDANTDDVGVITLSNPKKFKESDEIFSPQKKSSVDKLKAHKFISAVMSEGNKILGIADSENPEPAPVEKQSAEKPSFQDNPAVDTPLPPTPVISEPDPTPAPIPVLPEPEPTEPEREHHGRHERGFVYVAPHPDAGIALQAIQP